jgi:non-ribosomal peptide synthetase component F
MALRQDDVLPLDVPDRRYGVAAPADPFERLVLPVEVPATLASADHLLAGTLAFLSRIGGRQAVADIGLRLDGGPDRAFRLPAARGPFEDYEAQVRRGLDEIEPTGHPLVEFPIVVEAADMAEPALAALAGTGPALVVQITRCGGSSCRWIVDTAVWPRGSAEILRDSFRTFIAGLADGGELASVPLVDEAEQRRLEDAGLAADEGRCVTELIAEQVRERPGATAVEVADGDSVTYAELDRRVRCLATFLSRLGAAHGELVGVHLDRSIDLVVALLATLRTGAASVPLDQPGPATRPRVALTHGDLPAGVVAGEVIALDQAWPLIDATADPDGDDIEDQAMADGLAYVTAGVCVTHRALANLVGSWASEPGFTEDDTLVALTSACSELLLPLTVGGRLVLASAGDRIDDRHRPLPGAGH